MASDSELPKPHLPKPNLAPPSIPKMPPPSIPPVKVEGPPPVVNPAVTAPAPVEAAADEFDAEEVPKIVEATLANRIVGGLIDGAVGAVLFIILGMISSALGWLAMIAYLLVKDSLPFLNGQSLGKKLVKTKAVKITGESLSGDWTTGVTRNATMAIPFLSWVELIILLINKNEEIGLRRLGDQWAKTRVIPFDEATAALPPATPES